jgi:hypothetical protein
MSCSVTHQTTPLGLYLCRIQAPEDDSNHSNDVPSPNDLLKKVQSFYQGKEDLKYLGNCVLINWKFGPYNFGLDIYRMAFHCSYAQKLAVEQFNQLFDEYEGSFYNDHWCVFTEEEVQTTML